MTAPTWLPPRKVLVFFGLAAMGLVFLVGFGQGMAYQAEATCRRLGYVGAARMRSDEYACVAAPVALRELLAGRRAEK